MPDRRISCAANIRSLNAIVPQGEPAAARPLLERALGIDEEAYGPRHPAVATGLSNMALVLKALGEPAATEQEPGQPVDTGGQNLMGERFPSVRVNWWIEQIRKRLPGG
jgi:hypothetical protein